MKTLITLLLLTFAAHGQTQFVALITTNSSIASFNVPTNATVQLVAQNTTVTLYGVTPGGNTVRLNYTQGVTPPPYAGFSTLNLMPSGNSLQYATVQITTPETPLVSQYLPANAIVIPANETGNVMVTLQTSQDLVNWFPVEPGLFNCGQTTNRFFRVCAKVQ